MKLRPDEKALIIEALEDLRRRYEVPQDDNEEDNDAETKMLKIATLIYLFT